RSVEQVPRHANDSAALRLFEERALRPLVEGAHRRPAPDLVVQLPRRFAGVRPPAGKPQIPAEDQGHPVLRIHLRSGQLAWIAALEEVARLVPDLLEARAEVRLLNLDAVGLRNRFP